MSFVSMVHAACSDRHDSFFRWHCKARRVPYAHDREVVETGTAHQHDGNQPVASIYKELERQQCSIYKQPYHAWQMLISHEEPSGCNMYSVGICNVLCDMACNECAEAEHQCHLHTCARDYAATGCMQRAINCACSHITFSCQRAGDTRPFGSYASTYKLVLVVY